MVRTISLAKAAKVVMGQSPPGDTYNETGDGLPLLNGPTEFGHTFPHCTLFTTDSRRECEPGDLIFCVRGSTTGRMNWADRRYSLGRGVCAFRAGSQPETRFVRYCIQDKLHALLQLAGGGTFPNLTKDTIEDFEIPWPDNRVIIAGILSAYDEMIETSQRRIKVLEAMARTLYREWFVKFRFPGHENHSRVDSPVGVIPEGWEVKRLDAACRAILDGDWIETKDQSGSDYRLVQISNVGVDEFIETGNYRHVTQETFDRLRCNEIVPGDLLVARMPTPIGRGWLVTPMPWRMITAVDVAIIRVKQDAVHPLYFAQAWNEPSNLQRIAAQASGTTRLRITRRELAAMEFVLPPIELQRQFAIIVEPQRTMIEVLQQQTQNLRHTRDLLLPRLLSGQLDLHTEPERINS